ncbi:hypothetical protein [Streptomyces sp. NBC_00459]|uniref:hypothetical protein n=1 Tax=Streptomyces sp. NBC_00459 TaxID=2975749 RepID=UPI002E1841C1
MAADRDRLLTINIEFQIDKRKVYEGRIKAAYEQAITAAEDAVRDCLLPGSVHAIHSSMSYSTRYRHAVDGRWTDDAHEDEEPESPAALTG